MVLKCCSPSESPSRMREAPMPGTDVLKNGDLEVTIAAGEDTPLHMPVLKTDDADDADDRPSWRISSGGRWTMPKDLGCTGARNDCSTRLCAVGNAGSS